MKNLKVAPWFSFFLSLAIGTYAFSQDLEFPEEKVKVKFSIEQNGCEATVVAKVTVVPKWHINAAKLPKGSFLIPTELTIKKNSGLRLIGGNIEPKPIFKHDEMADEDLLYHEGTFLMKQKIQILDEKDFIVEGGFTFQTCNEVKCLPDFTYNFKLNAKGCVVEETIELNSKDIEATFVSNNKGIAKDKSGKEYVFVREKWNQVPDGNSAEFYKKYIEIIGNEK